MLTNPFIDLRVTPTYGMSQARLIWNVAPGFEKGRFIIFKSPDGINDWQEIGNVEAVREFVDEHLLTNGRLDQYYYRVILQCRGRRYDSPVIGTFGKLSRQEFAHARYIMDMEWKTLRYMTEIKIFKLKSNGKSCPRCVDPATGQKVGTTLCPVCYGTAYEGGYRNPVESRMRISTISPKVKANSDSGAGTSDPVKMKARMVAFPLLDVEDMLVDPAADRRYVVESIEFDWLNGKVPITCNVNLSLIDRNDIRYTFPV